MQRVPLDEFRRRIESTGTHELDCLPEGVEVRLGVPYAGSQLLDLFLPAAWQGRRPAILFVHGGGWAGGSRTQFQRQSAYFAAKHGMIAASLDYRLIDEAPHPACYDDVVSALDWLREQPGVDGDRIAIAGGSAGGHLAALAAMTRGGVAALIPLNAVLDLVPSIEKRDGITERAMGLLGKTGEEALSLAREISPLRLPAEKMPPTLLLHGEADGTVPVSLSIRMHEKLLAAGVHSEIELYPNGEHGWFNRSPHFAPVLDRLERFLVERLRL